MLGDKDIVITYVSSYSVWSWQYCQAWKFLVQNLHELNSEFLQFRDHVYCYRYCFNGWSGDNLTPIWDYLRSKGYPESTLRTEIRFHIKKWFHWWENDTDILSVIAQMFIMKGVNPENLLFYDISPSEEDTEYHFNEL